MVSLGIEELIAAPPAALKGKRLGLLCNQASTDRYFRHSRDLIAQAFPGQLSCLLTPQHGFFCEKQDNMIESGHGRDPQTGLPVFSLYGETRRPTAQMFEHLDVLLVDLIDVGTRVYTFMSTLAYCLEEAARSGKKVVVLDRPNPVDGVHIEGNPVDEELFSFVGLYPIPMRHGLTFGELGLLFNNHFGINADYEVIPMQGWQRQMTFADTGLPWLFPSPNMPTAATAAVYPGQVIWEGTNISEGRGTTMPFELFGAPFLQQQRIIEFLDHSLLSGCFLRPLMFQPTANKWAVENCLGFQLHVTDHLVFKPYRVSLALLQAFMKLYPADFAFKSPPYEYEFEKLPIDLILGSKKVREALADGVDIVELERSWQDDLQQFNDARQKYFLY
ncbi:MAG: DUF1343 domain-containing protein [Proteobacteria bacterium]|nr:DUF1343 domain-containing protein [Pseudomonadota bacterium]MBU4298239.1 DUF1343 domain-containing protein [Pseudomonadota bacterium]